MKIKKAKMLKAVFWLLYLCALGSRVERVQVSALISERHWIGLVCANSCFHEELRFYLEDSLNSDLFCISVQEQFMLLEQCGASLQKGSLLLLPHCRCFSERTYVPAVRGGTQRQASGLGSPRIDLLSLRVILACAHEAEHFFTCLSHLWQAPPPGLELHFHYTCFLGWCVTSACQCQSPCACHLSQLSSKHYKSWCSS